MGENKAVAKRLVKDDDGHWYLIPVTDEDTFRAWVASTQWDFEGEYAGRNYNDCRINGPHTLEIFGRCEEFGKEVG